MKASGPSAPELFEELIRTEHRRWALREKVLYDTRMHFKTSTLVFFGAGITGVLSFLVFWYVAETTGKEPSFEKINMICFICVFVVIYGLNKVRFPDCGDMFATNWAQALSNLRNPSWVMGVPTLSRDLFMDADAHDLLYLSTMTP